MLKWGINCNNHDASLSIVKNDEILFASSTERFSKKKNDSLLNNGIVKYCLDNFGEPNEIVIAENPLLKKLRILYSQQFNKLFDNSKNHVQKYFNKCKISYKDHHLSHAQSGYYTSKFKESLIVVIDAIGDNECISVWKGVDNKIELLHKIYYPHSIGLLYSAFTKFIGLKPNEEEYITMGLSAYGEPTYQQYIEELFISYNNFLDFKLKINPHCGIEKIFYSNEFKKENLAASIQSIYEKFLLGFCKESLELYKSENLVLMGGCALNCVANTKLLDSSIFNNIWIFPNPGDSGNGLGSILNNHVEFNMPYFGYDLKKTTQIDNVIDDLKQNKIVGLCNGRAEFGPRALGNRSLLANARAPFIKDDLNLFKQRENFRPFACVILEEYFNDYFYTNITSSPYMQYVFKIKSKESFPGVCHVDSTCRVQTLNKTQNSQLYDILIKWFEETGQPLLINTSINIKGQPLLNDEFDCLRFQEKYNIKIY